MKELSIIKQMVADGQVSQEVAEKYFPELAESDDEKIRKLLIEVVTQVLQDQYCSNRGVPKEKVISWLEKQGGHLENYDEAEKEKADFVADKFKNFDGKE